MTLDVETKQPIEIPILLPIGTRACDSWGVSWLAHLPSIQKRLRDLLRRAGRSPEDTEDLIQEALLRLHEYRQTARIQHQEAFLIRTVRNLSIDWHRTSHRDRYAKKPVEDLVDALALADESPAPDVIFNAQDRLYRIGTKLEAISKRTRDIYFAHVAGYSYAEISAQMGVSKSTIEKHIARAVLVLMNEREPE
jgi:RNA polymerase sigma factor (sigma-70 family)